MPDEEAREPLIEIEQDPQQSPADGVIGNERPMLLGGERAPGLLPPTRFTIKPGR